MPHTSFDVQQHGFRFSNSFDNYRFFGPIEIDLAGRCGGMSYSALDYFFSQMPIPPQPDLPVEGSYLSTYISSRQERSIWNEIDKWVELSFNPGGARNSEFFNWGLQEDGSGSLGQLIREIDAGRPTVLGLFSVSSGDPSHHHQVVAVGYERASGGSPLSISVYDSNHPGVEKVLQPHPQELQYTYPDSSDGERWLTYFVDLNYRVHRPPTQEELTGCSGIDFSNQNLSGQNLSNGDYRCANCVNTNFTGCTINQGDFELANLERANFYGANLRNTNFKDARLVSANFYGADLKVTQFIFADVRNGTFRGADVKQADLSNAMLTHCDFYGADLKNTVFLSADISNGTLRGADIKFADLSNATLTSCDFYGADLARATLSGAVCNSGNFYGASLNTASLVGTQFRGAILVGADLRNADARNADFTFANLTGADLSGANLDGAIGI